MTALAVVAQTRALSIAIQFAFAFLFIAGFHWQRDTGDPVAIVLFPVLALVLLSYRVRDRMTLDTGGLTLRWSPLSLGPIPLLRREAFVPWGRVRSLRHNTQFVPFPTSPYFLFFPRRYVVEMEVEGRKMTWRLGWHTSNTKAAVTMLAAQVSGNALSPEVREDVKRWRAAGAI